MNPTSGFHQQLLSAAAVLPLSQVLTPDKPRFSISGWYHGPAPPEGADKASLQQLQARAGEDAVRQHVLYDTGDHDQGERQRQLVTQCVTYRSLLALTVLDVLHPVAQSLSHSCLPNCLSCVFMHAYRCFIRYHTE